MSKTFFIDTTRCTACRGCQVACKEWQEFPANKTTQLGWGKHQNPPDLNPYNYKVVRFEEHKIKGRVVWNFFTDQCRHCIDPPCKYAADTENKKAVIVDKETGAVIYTEETKKLSKKAFEEMRQNCPYGIPQRDEKSGIINKCDMCYDRVEDALLPMCVKACPTGAMNFGKREDMLKMAHERLDNVKKNYPDAQLVGEKSLRVVYLVSYKPELYHKNLAEVDSFGISRKAAIAKFTAPLRNMFK